MLRPWAKELSADPMQAFPGHGQKSLSSLRSSGCARRTPNCGRSATCLKKGGSVLREGSEMKFAFIAKHRHVWPVSWLCEALDVSRSGFHAWLQREPSARAAADEELTARKSAQAS
jgi:putative transposase